MTGKKELLRKFLSGIESGDAMAAAVVDESKYIQHNPMTREGSIGIAELFARLAKTNPKVRFVRVFEDGDFAFAHNEYDFSSTKAAFEVFRFENDRAVEHWDNIQGLEGPNPSGRGMLDGATAITDLDRTEANRGLVRSFVETVLIGRQLDRLSEFVNSALIQHNPGMADGTAALRATLSEMTPKGPALRYDRLHRVLAEGNFVLAICEGHRLGAHSSLYDLYRLEAGRIVEHWDTVETIPPRETWANNNGKF